MPSANYTNRILPSFFKAFSLDGDYRCERDLHHHLTALFNEVSPLRIGQSNTLVRYEMPTLGRYQWTGSTPDSGNIDIVFLANDEPEFATSSGGTAIEINCNYPSVTKSKQDLIKLLDPTCRFAESVYVVFGTERAMRRSIESAFAEAVAYLSRVCEGRILTPCRILLVEEVGGLRFLFEGTPIESDGELEVAWSELQQRNLVAGCQHDGDPMRRVTKLECETLLKDRMRREGIPLSSKTARCMFEATTTSDGRRVCHFGNTPLWDHEVEVQDGSVVYIEFMDWLNRLVENGKSRQGR